MPKLEDSVKGEKPFGVMIYEPPYTFLSCITSSDGDERTMQLSTYGAVRGALRLF